MNIDGVWQNAETIMRTKKLIVQSSFIFCFIIIFRRLQPVDIIVKNILDKFKFEITLWKKTEEIYF